MFEEQPGSHPARAGQTDSGSSKLDDVPLSAGACGLLQHCVKGQPGERLLIVSEPKGAGYYDDDTVQMTATAARASGLKVYQTQAPVSLGSPGEIAAFIDVLTGFDHVIFFARVGDQLRFNELSALPSSTMCYTLDKDMLDSAFGTACYQGLCDVKAFIDKAFQEAMHIRVTCPLGTDYSGKVMWQEQAIADVSLKRFPMLVPKPIPARGFSGKVVLSRFLVGTGAHFYEPYSLSLNEDVHAVVENNRLVRFLGSKKEVARVNAHHEDIAKRFGVDPWYVHSWHSGIHPGCSFPSDARNNLLRWSGSAFGNPRVLHFHTCGEYAPGEISWTIIDPTICIDDVPVWENGNLYPERLAGGEHLLDAHARLRELYRQPLRDIGLFD
ncbi:MAG: hypothetical protein AB8B87_00730 [Granulosicoccus sp.]